MLRTVVRQSLMKQRTNNILSFERGCLYRAPLSHLEDIGMEIMKQSIKASAQYIKALLKWTLLASVVGIIGGAVGSAFHISIDFVTELRSQHAWLVYLLPLGGLAIAGMYTLFKKYGRLDTNRILEAVQTEEKVPFVLAPLIFIGAVITHLLGGSAGREGAALQLGGSIGYRIGKTLKLGKDDMHIIVMSGMSAVFAALFGTPLTAAVFALEVTCVGIMYYAALFPCIIASLVAFGMAGLFDIPPVRFAGVALESVSWDIAVKLMVLAVLCALVSIIFCTSIKSCERLGKRFVPNVYVRAFAGGVIVVLLTVILGTTDYNGAGMQVIERALGGEAHPWAFALKIVFTAITIAAGFKGGEIVPAFFVGSTFGCMISSLIGLEPALGAAIGFVAVFCGVVNCPIASIMLALEVFGADSVPLFAAVCAVSYMMSGNYGLYKSQKIVYSKLDAHYIDVNAG